MAPAARRVPPAAAAVLVLALAAAGVAGHATEKTKRQIFREQVLPHTGGKIPSGAFRADRLVLNRLNKEGIAVPDGILLDARKRHKDPSQRGGSDLEAAVVKVTLTDDGRYTAPEGRLHATHPETVDSTYIIRPPFKGFGRQHGLWPPRPRPAHSFAVPASRPLQQQPPPPQTLYGRPAAAWAPRAFPRLSDSEADASFSCAGRSPDRLYADLRSRCQGFHVCQRDGRRDSFLCPHGTAFNELTEQCDWWHNVKCF
ncbi:uncharacterized protein LOC126471294 [Schistocerca serialis cubense]|uniref:uncharacterized protein LOC126471294 n=1 Tax=Schistocerca serialis cubense TaxID=2023355 RepID=UPI00214EE004|nr:uncharacterized protein LOC126471294 [Schistocerca serialis cubense]